MNLMEKKVTKVHILAKKAKALQDNLDGTKKDLKEQNIFATEDDAARVYKSSIKKVEDLGDRGIAE